MSEIAMPTLITNRTEADFSRLDELSMIPWRLMNDAQKMAWEQDSLGAYNISDINRVESAVEYLAARLVSLPQELREYVEEVGAGWQDDYDVPYDPGVLIFEPKTDWGETDIPRGEDTERFLFQLKTLRDNTFQIEAPELPETMWGITFEEANNIEQMLLILYEALTAFELEVKETIQTEAAQFKLHSGEIYSGEV